MNTQEMLEKLGMALYLHIKLAVNLDKLDANYREQCLRNIESGVAELKQYLEENLKLKEGIPDIPETGLAVLKQQYILVQSIETWLDTLTSTNE